MVTSGYYGLPQVTSGYPEAQYTVS